MSKRTLCITEKLYDYMVDVSLRDSDLLRQLREETAKDEMAQMQISPEQGQFMTLLIHLIKARKTIEIGVYTGYSALCTAMALPDDGKLIACDISKKWTTIAKRYWEKAGVDHKIDLRLAPAVDTLGELLASGQESTFDFIFIDADKTEYNHYYEMGLKLLRTGGLIAVDNVLWDGAVADKSVHDEDTEAIRTFNKKVHADPRVEISLVPIADGLTLARKI